MIDRAALQRWFSTLDSSKFINEDDVETKFVIPLFDYLGYPSVHRRGKYPINVYTTDRSTKGRKPEIDQIYFATDDPRNQNGDTALVLVEVKKTSEIDLAPAIQQAKFYAAHINPVLIVVTNGLRIIVLENSSLRETKEMFSYSLEDLKHDIALHALCDCLDFDHIMKINADLAHDIRYKTYIELDRILMNQPEIREHLKKGDFNSDMSHHGLELIVSQPKVRIECTLPITYKDGSCKITFSSILLRGLVITLDHETIVGDLLQGLGTSPYWKTRHFLEKQDNGYFSAILGKTTVTLSEIEAFDLCFCIDEVGNRYKQRMIANEDILQSWNYPIKRVYFDEPGDFVEGYYVLSVDKWLWKLMHKFSVKYSMFNKQNKTEWHIFWDLNRMIRLHINDVNNVWLYPVDKNLTIDIIYQDFGSHIFDKQKIDWNQSVGAKGYWTLPYTEMWLRHEFIPKVLDEYSDEFEDDGNTLQDAIEREDYDRRDIIDLAEKPIDLLPYMEDISRWVIVGAKKYIKAQILIPYYYYFSNLCRYVDRSRIHFGYMVSKLYIMSEYNYRLFDDFDKNYNDVLKDLKKQAERIQTIEYELRHDADMMTRIFKSVLDYIDDGYPQEVFNGLKYSLIPLWQLARFELRHVIPFRSSR